MSNASDIGTPTSRQDVFAAIESERLYQVAKWGYRQPDGSLTEAKHGVCDYLCYMHDYLEAAIKAASRQPGNNGALEELRKVVTLGVACFEQHGIKPRDLAGVANARDGLPP